MLKIMIDKFPETVDIFPTPGKSLRHNNSLLVVFRPTIGLGPIVSRLSVGRYRSRYLKEYGTIFYRYDYSTALVSLLLLVRQRFQERSGGWEGVGVELARTSLGEVPFLKCKMFQKELLTLFLLVPFPTPPLHDSITQPTST